MSSPSASSSSVASSSVVEDTEPQGASQTTGDPAVDEALGLLDGVTHEPLDTQIEVGERVHRVLQGRLADLGRE